MSLTAIMAEDRRLHILAALAEAVGFELNETALRVVLRAFAHNVTGDVVRGDLTWLTDHGMIRVRHLEQPEGTLWIAHLRQAGQDVAAGAPYPGIARPRAG